MSLGKGEAIAFMVKQGRRRNQAPAFLQHERLAEVNAQCHATEHACGWKMSRSRDIFLTLVTTLTHGNESIKLM